MPTPILLTGSFQHRSQPFPNIETERWSKIVFLPIAGTFFFYLLPDSFQQQRVFQFLPQVLACIGLAIWSYNNSDIHIRLGIQPDLCWHGLQWGCVIGLALGLSNTLIILKGIPALGIDILFLTQTPHAEVPTSLMIPWVIMTIAILSELNFRGFLLGRLVVLFDQTPPLQHNQQRNTLTSRQALAIATSATLFAFDPFIVNTFQHLHWIAVYDGIIWGWVWVRFRNLYTVIAAHAIEVLILYTCIKIALT